MFTHYDMLYGCYSGSLVIIIGGISTGFASNFIALLTMRSFVGFGAGGSAVAFDLLAEFLPRKARVLHYELRIIFMSYDFFKILLRICCQGHVSD